MTLSAVKAAMIPFAPILQQREFAPVPAPAAEVEAEKGEEDRVLLGIASDSAVHLLHRDATAMLHASLSEIAAQMPAPHAVTVTNRLSCRNCRTLIVPSPVLPDNLPFLRPSIVGIMAWRWSRGGQEEDVDEGYQ